MRINEKSLLSKHQKQLFCKLKDCGFCITEKLLDTTFNMRPDGGRFNCGDERGTRQKDKQTRDLDSLDRLGGVVGDVDVDTDGFPVVVQLFGNALWEKEASISELHQI